ncbi:hypothetical protein VB780_08535 [Leptolyngbya sp. CCNP1308]|uniref:HpsJ-like protein, cyanoexosortase C-associated n=1 Tax=Leptolyngbya sp. CCNP1308 TaxID=3110255 RepID=UPI002B22191B|nr:hypothetical protein [Leptolyngbya sp. CCNP1308]MEA5448608.1 hypothetical protein [Leptolyngbya sp. CCNP1308]
MTSMSNATYVSLPRANSHTSKIFLILGLACIVGFVINMATFAIPPNPMALEWRLVFLQQIGNRSILLFLGTAMLLYSLLDLPSLVKPLALACLIMGIVLPLSCVLLVRDHLVLQTQTMTSIDNQAQALQTQIQIAENDPSRPTEVTPELLQQAMAQVESQTDSLIQNARNNTTKSIVANAGNLIVIGLGLISLGRFGIKQTV